MTDAARRRLALLGRTLTPLVAVALVVRAVDVRTTLARLQHVGLGAAAVALAITPALYALYALRWSFTARRLGVPLSFGRAFGEYYVSTLLNQLLPFGVAGDVTRALRHGAREGALAPAARAVVLERLSGLVGLALFVGGGAVVWSQRGSRELCGIAIAALVIVALAASVTAWRVRDARRALVDRGAFAVQLALSSAAVVLLVLLFVFSARAVGVVLAFPTALAVVPLVLAATVVPFAFGGWGVREATTAALYRLLGLDPATGVAVSIAFGVANLVAALPGAIVLARGGRGRR